MSHAYVTTLCNGDGYLPGVEVLGKSLEASGTQKTKVVLVTADISAAARERLARQGWQLRDIEPIANPAADRLLFPRFASVFAKLRAWELVEFERVVLLDADTLVLQNVDDLFERRTFAAGPDFFLPDHFNSGVMVLEPSADTFGRMIEALAVAGTYDGGDQGFLNTFYADWYAMPVEHRLPVGYNMAHFIYQFLRGHPTLKATLERDAKIIHYMVQKPWQAKTTLTGGSAAWWHMYFEAHPEKAHEWKEKVHEFEDWSFDHLAALVLG
ncbi:MAG TPA: glycosyltransferase family 8 protein [Labilithrix sp.]|nr:glycosyltransferase family 8 protein [Labilithrix sp.]